MIVCIIFTHDWETERSFVGTVVEQNKQLVCVKQNIPTEISNRKQMSHMAYSGAFGARGCPLCSRLDPPPNMHEIYGIYELRKIL